MSLFSRIEADFLAAYKAKEEERVSVLRMLKTSLKNKQVELKRELTDEEVLDAISKEAKKRLEAEEQFRNAGREEMADKEAREGVLLKAYLPEPLSAEEVGRIVDEAIAATGAAGPQDMGKVMQAVMGQCKGRVDGKELSGLVRSRLAS
ncbi:MAG: GatB/YqeY domain-containing protein [Desulfovibrio sp.]|nr:MAG: GatB/YqeY domain-containing protein [Desulfovibrio sp.]